MDSFIGSALFPAISTVQRDLDVGPTEITWAFAAYSATFAAFLLISGRIADVYSARMFEWGRTVARGITNLLSALRSL